jgi:formate dehydrogenase iron-sulfur subunit
VGIDRKTFLKTAGVLGASLTGLPSITKGRVRMVSPDWMGVLTDLRLCIGCRKCEWACNEANGLPNQSMLKNNACTALSRPVHQRVW